MSAERDRRIVELLRGALEVPAEERPRYLAERAGGDRALVEECLGLLADSEGEDPRLEPLLSLTLGGEGALAAGESIGPWRLVRPLGVGGMGEVWLAERADGAYEQRVAIKVPRAERAGPAGFQRLERERALLATLDHPGVARLLDGGWTASGRPWFAMEYVEGDPLDEHVRSRGLGVREVVSLLAQTARILGAAHRRRVVHRDLKPANVLVRPDGRVALVDFGIAHVLGEARGARGSYAATPRYASPEQLNGEPPTTASDVYSLARMAKELVADPDRDLAAILAAGLLEDPEARISSGEALAREFQRWLEHQPVESRRAGWLWRVRLYGRRSPLALSALLALSFGWAGALVLTTHLWRKEQRQRAALEAAQGELRLRFDQVRALVAELVFGVHDRIRTLPGAVPARLFVIERARAHLEQLAEELAGNRELTLEWIGVALRLADVQGTRTAGHVGDLDGALATAGAAVERARGLTELDPNDLEAAEREAVALRVVGDLERARGRWDAARAAYEASLALLSRPAPAVLDPGTAARDRQLAERVERAQAVANLQLGKLAVARGDFGAADRLFAAAQEIWERASAAEQVGARSDLVHVLSERAYARTQVGDDRAALALWDAALSQWPQTPGGEPVDAQALRERGELELERALSACLLGEEGAWQALERALGDARKLFEWDGDNLLARRHFERALLRAARGSAAFGDSPRAAALYREAEVSLRSTRERMQGDWDLAQDLAESLGGWAESRRRLGEHEGVEAAFLEALELLEPEAALERGDHRAGNLATLCYVGLGNVPLSDGDPVAARAVFERHLEATLAWWERFPELPWTPRHLGALEYGRGLAAERQAAQEGLLASERKAHLEAAMGAFGRGLAIAQQLEREGRLAPHERDLASYYAADVARVERELSRPGP